MSTSEIPETANPNPYYEHVPHKLKNADVEPVKPLSSEVMQSVERLMEEIFSLESDEVMLNAPNRILSDGNELGVPGITHHSEIDFGDVETYHEVIDRFLLNFGENPQLVKDGVSFAKNFVRFVNPEISDVPVYATVCFIAPPLVPVAMVDIIKVPRRP